MKLTPRGALTWFLEFRYRGDARKLRLGGKELTLKLARERAASALRKIADGDDPTDPERQRRQSRTVADLWARFKRDYLPDHESERSQATTVGVWENYILPEIGRKKLIDLTDDDVRALVRKVSAYTERTARNGKT